MLRFVAFNFLVRHTRTTVHVLHFASTSRGRASFCIPFDMFTNLSRGRALCYRVLFLCLPSDLRRIYIALRLCHFMRRLVFALNQIALFSVEALRYLSLRCASRARSYPRAALCSFVIVLSTTRVVNPAASLEICPRLFLATR